jgi:hypothetical protein
LLDLSGVVLLQVESLLAFLELAVLFEGERASIPEVLLLILILRRSEVLINYCLLSSPLSVIDLSSQLFLAV